MNEEITSNFSNKDTVLNQIYNLRIQNINCEVEEWNLEVEVKNNGQFDKYFKAEHNLVSRKPTVFKKILTTYYAFQGLS